MFRRNILNLFIQRSYCNIHNKIFNWKELKYKTKVPQNVVKSIFEEKTEKIKVTEEEIILLEKLSLVDLERKEAVKVLEDSIEFASKIHNIKTDQNIEPLYTVLENYQLKLREDKVTDGNIKQDVMKNAVKTEEETYFVSPK
ncbi:hypothetical protein PVAND_010319 [Polypedilum vanderplanki]|uniref:Glutamyl-tRNA(Gln) amidotransferase subunit C, mitochondrial n=1 Tax=Polypedilum vanderplanki TaxID=319348 RepID=A0A9J6CFW9_POLVA|nr:hypothetical protein PVAND_010319 [Polypedilum vanderplanki]